MDDSNSRSREVPTFHATTNTQFHATTNTQFQAEGDQTQPPSGSEQQQDPQVHCYSPQSDLMTVSTEHLRPALVNTTGLTTSAVGPSQGMPLTLDYTAYYHGPSTPFSGPMTQSPVSYRTSQSYEGRQTDPFGNYNTNVLYGVSPSTSNRSIYSIDQLSLRPAGAGRTIVAPRISAPYQTLDPPQTGGFSALPASQQSDPTPTNPFRQSLPQNCPNRLSFQHTEEFNTDRTNLDNSSVPSNEMGHMLNDIRSRLPSIFEDILCDKVKEARNKLIGVSELIMSKLEDLGLAVDNPTLYPERIRFWHDLNHAWLALSQRQEDLLKSGVAADKVMSSSELNGMAIHLIRLCDGLEPFALVDYDYGIREERILTTLGECADLMEGRKGEAMLDGATTRMRSPEQPRDDKWSSRDIKSALGGSPATGPFRP